MTTKDEVKTLWKLCFNDSDEFTDLYFKMRYKDEVNRVIREDGKIISALQMIPYPMTFCDEVISTSYISGACTHPDYRKHGAMKRLLNETHRCIYQRQVNGQEQAAIRSLLRSAAQRHTPFPSDRS